MKEGNRLCSGYLLKFLPIGVLPEVFGGTASLLSICLCMYVKDKLILEHLKDDMSEITFNIFKEKIRRFYLFRDDTEVKP